MKKKENSPCLAIWLAVLWRWLLLLVDDGVDDAAVNITVAVQIGWC